MSLAASYALRDQPGDAAKAAEEIQKLLQAGPEWTVTKAARQPLQRPEIVSTGFPVCGKLAYRKADKAFRGF